MANPTYGDYRDRNDRSDYSDRPRYARGEYGRDRDHDRGFLERAGDEIRSWFEGDDDRDRNRDHRRDRDYDRGRFSSSSDRSYGGSDRYGRDSDRFDSGRNERSWDRGSSGAYGSRFGNDYEGRDRDTLRSGMNRPAQSRQASEPYGRDRDEWRGGRQSWDRDNERGRDDDTVTGVVMYEEYSGTLGGFGNQQFASSQDDMYRNWRDSQMRQLDRDYQDYCRERQQQFHQDFDSWRSGRKGQSRSQSEGGLIGSQDGDRKIGESGSSGTSKSATGSQSQSAERATETSGSSSSRSGKSPRS